MPITHEHPLQLETTPMTLSTIVVATDFSPVARQAFNVAAEMASNYGAQLVIAHVMMPAAATPLTAASGRQLQASSLSARQELAQLAHSATARDLKVHTILKFGAIGEQVLDVLKREKADLLVLGTHAGHGLEKLLMGSTAEALFRSSPVPVMTVGPEGSRIHLPLKRILYATDLSVKGLRAAQYATSLAEESDADIMYLHVLGHEDGARDEAWKEAASRLRELVPEDVEEFCRPLFVVDCGDPADRILRNAQQQHADLIVLSVSTPLMADHATWSIASKVVRESSCPVLTVRDHF